MTQDNSVISWMSQGIVLIRNYKIQAVCMDNQVVLIGNQHQFEARDNQLLGYITRRTLPCIHTLVKKLEN